MKNLKLKSSLSKVKIIAGSWKGQYIKISPDLDIRPTKNIIRETLFNWLSKSIDKSICLDLYTGSGAISVEAASRGAKEVTLVDVERNNISFLQNELSKFHYDGFKFVNSTAEDYIKSCKVKYDIIFLDPPFKGKELENIIKVLEVSEIIKIGSIVYIEASLLSLSQVLDSVPTSWEELKSKKSGNVAYLLFSVC
tara:strand:+ start:540 stop:1124 length:585 start_codon:yes stop_codon:yes gene_type:complete